MPQLFSEASHTEFRQPFDFPTRISGFPMEMLSTPGLVPFIENNKHIQSSGKV